MKVLNTAIQEADESGFLTPQADELHRNAYLTSSLRQKIQEGRGWEKGLAGMVRHALTPGAVSGEPGWKRYRFKGSDTIFVFESFAEWITDPNGLGTQSKHLIELLQVSPDEADRALAARVEDELGLAHGGDRRSEDFKCKKLTFENESAPALPDRNLGSSAAGVRRKIRNWLRANATHPNHDLAQEWLAKLEANPRSRLHQQALREIGIGGERKKLLDVSGVSDALLDRLHALARDEGIAVAELIEDALAVYFRMDEEGWPATEEPAEEPVPPLPPVIESPTPDMASADSDDSPDAIEPPAPGFYSPSELATRLGRKRDSLGSLIAKAADGGEILQKVLCDMPIRILIHKSRPPAERCEVVAR